MKTGTSRGGRKGPVLCSGAPVPDVYRICCGSSFRDLIVVKRRQRDKGLRRPAGMRAVVLLAALTTPCLGSVWLQAGQKFEVASIKPNRSGPDTIRRMSLVPGGWRAINLPLVTIFAVAHQVQPGQIISLPPWAMSEAFDITARVPQGISVSMDTLRPMLIDLLVERFHLKTHVDKRDLSVYRLVRLHPNELGPKLAAAEVDCTGRGGAPATPEAISRMRNCGAGPRATGVSVHGMPIQTLAALLAPTVGRVVVDDTGLSGNRDLDLEFTSDRTKGADDVSVFAALQEQLGLKLEAGRTPVDVIVVDHIDRPSED
jgi:uncharacterized protein (TIGR03435 family)